MRPAGYPADDVLSVCSNTGYTVYTEDDLYSASIPAALGANINSTDRVLSGRAVGIGYHNALIPPIISFGTTRNHDLGGCMWHTIETSLGVYDWYRMDAWIEHCYATSVDPIFCWGSSPGFRSARPSEAAPYGLGTAAEPANLSDVSDFLAMVAARYLARGTPIKYWEIGNEAKYFASANGAYFSGTPAVLATITRLANIAIKAVDPTAKILSMSPTGCEFAWVLDDNSGSDYLHKMLSASDGAGGFGKDWVDIIAFHSYGHDGFNNLFAIPQMVANMRAVAAANGLSTSVPLWVTEGSAITPPYNTQSIQDRKDFLSRTLLLAFGAGVERFVWYSDGASLGGFSGNPELAAHWDYMHGLLSGATLGVVNHEPPKSMGEWNNNGKRYGRVFAVINGTRHVF